MNDKIKWIDALSEPAVALAAHVWKKDLAETWGILSRAIQNEELSSHLPLTEFQDYIRLFIPPISIQPTPPILPTKVEIDEEWINGIKKQAENLLVKSMEIKMNNQIHYEIHFQDENTARAFLKSDLTGIEKNFCEILFFCHLATRQLHNLKSNKVSTSLAEILSTMYTEAGDYSDFMHLMVKLKNEADIPYYLPFIGALGINISKLIGLIPSLGIYRTVNKLSNEQIASQICPTIAQVKEYDGINGQKHFVAIMELKDKRVINFDLQPKGFSFLGEGINYYAPMSVILTFKYLYSLHDDWELENSNFRKALKKAANLCGEYFMQGKITSISQVTLPLEITNQVYSSKQS